MKTIKNLIIATLVAFSGLCLADNSGCERYATAEGVSACHRQWIQNTREHLFALMSRLTNDVNKLGLTKEERKSVFDYYNAVEEDNKKRCGISEFDCRYEVYATAYHELKAFEDKKIKEKQARTSVSARPSFAPGKTQPVANTAFATQSAEVAQANEEEVGD